MNRYNSKWALALVTILAAVAGGEATMLYQAHQDRMFGPRRFADRTPLAGMAQMENEMDRMLGVHPMGMFTMNRMTDPQLDLKDTGKAYTITADLPGMNKSDINVSLDGQLLNVTGVRDNSTRTGWFRRKQGASEISRFEGAVELPQAVDASGMKASYRHGTLTITVPKEMQESTARKVPVR